MDTSAMTCKGKWFEKNLRNIPENSCNFTSKSTFDYNCVGFAVGDYLWWHPVKQKEHFWPANVARNGWAKTYVEAIITTRFEISPIQNASPEDGYEKIVVFHKGNKFTHAAVISSDTIWKSKLGESEDLEHPPAGNKMGKYGLVFKFLRRNVQYARLPLPDEYRI